MKNPLFINTFQKGSQQNSNIGLGVLVNINNDASKGVARLSRKTFNTNSSEVTDLVLHMVKNGGTIYALGDTGKIYKQNTEASGINSAFTVLSGAGTVGGHGNGLMYFDGYLFIFGDDFIDYYNVGTSTMFAGWKTFPIPAHSRNHYCFLYPTNNGFYWCNDNKIGFIGKIGITTFNPAGVLNTDYAYTPSILTLPSYYVSTALAFLPPTYLCIGTQNVQDTVCADIIQWDTVTLNKFNPPLRLYSKISNAQITSSHINPGGVVHLLNVNNILYVTLAGSSAFYRTNGNNFSFIDNISERMQYRLSGGTQSQAPIFLSGSHVSAMTVMNDKILFAPSYTGTPPLYTIPAGGYGAYPLGVWSYDFTQEDTIPNCEYIISTETTNSATNFEIGTILATASNSAFISWKDNTTYGIDYIDPSFLTNSMASIESEMFEIGTPIIPQTINSIEFNLTRNLQTNQFIAVDYRTQFDKDFVTLTAFMGDNTTNQYTILSNSIGETRFIQLRIRPNTNSISSQESPEFRNIIIK